MAEKIENIRVTLDAALELWIVAGVGESLEKVRSALRWSCGRAGVEKSLEKVCSALRWSCG
ncbi:MAG: hypothetical protein KH828_13595 [Clostridiales bacterium]|nr:hypothetical protein [Clostridiales bacterium]